MSFLFNWLNGKTKTVPNKDTNVSDTKLLTDGDNLTKSDSKDEQLIQTTKPVKKWVPNDVLYKKYNNFLERVSEINKHKNSQTKLITRSKQLMKQYNMESKSDDITLKIAASQTKQELFNVETKLRQSESAVHKLETMDSKVLDEWNDYVEQARNFLIENQIDEGINVNDILNTPTLFATMKKFMDGYYITANYEKHLDTIVQLDTFFNVANTRNTLKITQGEFETRRKKLLDKIQPTQIIDDLSVPHKLQAIAANETNSSTNNLTITGPVQIVTATPLLDGEQVRNNIPVVHATITDEPTITDETNILESNEVNQIISPGETIPPEPSEQTEPSEPSRQLEKSEPIYVVQESS